MPKLVLIQDPDAVISVDLAQTVMEAWPDATVVICRGIEDVLACLRSGKKISMMVLRQSMRSLLSKDLVPLARDAASHVLLTAADEQESDLIVAEGWSSLDMPFTTEQLLAALRIDSDPARI
ncbi:MAG: hypothetical protein ACK4RZ_09425 [Paracoccaceae bacterium]